MIRLGPTRADEQQSSDGESGQNNELAIVEVTGTIPLDSASRGSARIFVAAHIIPRATSAAVGTALAGYIRRDPARS